MYAILCQYVSFMHVPIDAELKTSIEALNAITEELNIKLEKL